jgi:hypothetical protein
MRRAILILVVVSVLFFIAGGISNADDVIAVKNAKTRIEAFLTQKGRLIGKEVYILGRVTGLYSSSCMISAIITYEPDDKENRLKGLIIEVNEGQSNDRLYSSFLDIEEIEGLSTAIASMVRLTEKRSKTENSYEVIYTTGDELSFGVYFSEGEEGGFISTGSVGKLTVSLEPKQLNEVKKIIDYGYTILKMK